MKSKNNSAEGMNPSTGKIIAVIVFVIAIGIFSLLIIKSPLGKALSNLLGGVAGLFSAVDQQLKTCQDNGVFNVSKGCYLGVVGIVSAVLFLASLFVRGWISTKNEAVEKIAILSEKSPMKVVSEITADLDINTEFKDKDGKTQDVDNEFRSKAYERAFNNNASTRAVKEIEMQRINPEAKRKAQERIVEQQESYNKKLAEGYTTEEEEKQKDLADDMDKTTPDPPEPPEPPDPPF
jgi:hypothetical protein